MAMRRGADAGAGPRGATPSTRRGVPPGSGLRDTDALGLAAADGEVDLAHAQLDGIAERGRGARLDRRAGTRHPSSMRRRAMAGSPKMPAITPDSPGASSASRRSPRPAPWARRSRARLAACRGLFLAGQRLLEAAGLTDAAAVRHRGAARRAGAEGGAEPHRVGWSERMNEVSRNSSTITCGLTRCSIMQASSRRRPPAPAASR